MRIFILFVCLFMVPVIGQAQEQTLLDSGYSFYDKGEYDAAIRIFKLAANQMPDNPEVYYLLGVCRSLTGDNYTALQEYEKAIALDPNYAEAYYETGYAQYLMGRLDEAMKSFDKAIELRPDYAEAYINRGSLKCMLDDAEGAEQDWKRAAELGAALPVAECR